MARLPQPGGDNGNWGDILNDYLSQSLKSDGRLHDNSVTANTIAPNSITNAAIASDAVNATSIADGSITSTLIADGTIQESKLEPAVQTKLNDATSTPAWSAITGKPTVIAAGGSQAAAKTVLGLVKDDVGLSSVDNTSDIAKPISAATQTALDAKSDLVGGKIPTAQLPAIALTEVVTVADEPAMLALTSSQVQPGDIAVRTDGAGTFVLTNADPSQLSSWTKLNAPTDAVTSVNGHTGTVVLGKSDVGLNNVDNTSDLAKPISTATQTALDAKADLIGGKIPTSQLPSLAITDVATVASQAAMLALTSAQVQRGDIAVRTDGAGTYILTDNDPSQLANWTLLNSPTDAVTSVNGKTGTVSLAKADVGLGNVDNTSDATKAVASAAKLTTPRKINGVNFDGATDITVADSTKEAAIASGTTSQYWRGDKTWQTLDKTAVGLGSVDNTSDLSKPVSTATQTALGKKAAIINPIDSSGNEVTNQKRMILYGAPESLNWVGLAGVTNDIAFNTNRGGSISATKNGSVIASGTNCFIPDATFDSYNGLISTDVFVFEVTLCTSFQYGQQYGVLFGQETWSCGGVKIEFYDSTIAGWLTGTVTTSNTSALVMTPIVSGGNGGANPTTKVRFTLSGPFNTTYNSIRIASFFAIGYASPLLKAGFMDRGGGDVYGYISTSLDPTNANHLTRKAYVDAAKYTRIVTTITTATTLGAAANTDYVTFVGSGGAPTLPTAVGNTSKYTIKNIDTTNKTVATTSSQTIDGSTTLTLTPNTSVDLLSDGTNWRII